MLETANRTHQHARMLQCVWVPSHTGANAPLTAVWIERVQCIPFDEQKQTPAVTEGCMKRCADEDVR
jgi:hypothetical protein